MNRKYNPNLFRLVSLEDNGKKPKGWKEYIYIKRPELNET